MKLSSIIPIILLLGVTGCDTISQWTKTDPNKPKPLRGPRGSWGYEVEVTTSDPGSKIEVNKEYVGDSPLKIMLYGDKDGTFHSNMDYDIRAYPVKSGQNLQWKVFTGGGHGQREDRVPKKIYFDLNLERAPEKSEIKLNVTTEERTPKK